MERIKPKGTPLYDRFGNPVESDQAKKKREEAEKEKALRKKALDMMRKFVQQDKMTIRAAQRKASKILGIKIQFVDDNRGENNK